MVTISILKRKDAASLVIGVVAAYIIIEFLGAFSNALLNSLSLFKGEYGQFASGSMSQYMRIIVTFLLELAILELGVRAYVYINSQLLSDKKR